MDRLVYKLPTYIVSGIAVALVVSLLPKNKFTFEKSIIFAVTTTSIFIVLDTICPESSLFDSFNGGLGFGIGAKHVGFNVEGFNEDTDLSILEKEMMASDDDDDNDNIENMFLEEYESDKQLSETPINEAFQGNVTAAERGLVFGQVVGGTHGTKIHELIYSGDVINISVIEDNEQDLFLQNDTKRNVVVFSPLSDKKTKRLNKLRIEGLGEKNKNFKKLNMLRYGDIIEFKHNDNSNDKYIANTDFGVLTGNYDTPHKQRQLFIIENEDDPINMSGKGISYGDIMRIKYVGSNAKANNYLASKEGGTIVTTNNSLEGRGIFTIKKCDINCSGPLWRYK